MATIFVWIFKSYKKVYLLVTGMIMFFCYYLIGKNSKLEINNENLKTNMEEFNIETEKIIAIQRKQMDIASRASLSRDLIHEWMRGSKNSGIK